MNQLNDSIKIHVTYPTINAIFDDIEKKILSPLCCMWESGSEWILEFDLPLVDKKDISVSYGDANTIIVEAKLRETYYDIRISQKNEFDYFQKSVTLPSKIDPQKITAKFTHGRLIIRIPKLFAGTKITIE